MTNREAVENYRAEVEAYRRLLQRNPGSLRFAEFADQLRRAGKLSDATTICARGLAHNPDYATGHLVMGEIFRDAGLLEKAERECREALRLDQAHPRAHLRLGELYLSRGQLKEATASFQAALMCKPDFPEAQARLEEARRGGGMGGAGEEGAAHADQWRPGERPTWLTSARLGELVEAVTGCQSVQTAGVINADGLLLEGTAPSAGRAEGGAGAPVELVREARDLTRRLAAGRLRGALICGEDGSVQCLPLGDLTLTAALNPETSAPAARAQIEEAVAALSRPKQGQEGCV